MINRLILKIFVGFFIVVINYLDILLLFIFAMASYIQVTTGFAFGLIVMATVTLLELIEIESAAFIVTVLTLVNTIVSLKGGLWKYVNMHAFFWILVASIPATFLGLWLLDHSNESQRGILQGILGLCLAGSSLMMMYRVTPREKNSSATAFAVSGLFSGLMGGLFATFGPPVTYMMYRQPYAISAIRATLLSFFSIAAIIRISGAVIFDPISGNMITLSVLGTPAVVFGAILARYFPPSISNNTLRRIAFGILLFSGVSLTVRAVV